MPKRVPAYDPISRHDVMLALSKARAMASVLEQLGETTGTAGNNLINAIEDGSHPTDTRAWLQGVVGAALRDALDDAESGIQALNEVTKTFNAGCDRLQAKILELATAMHGPDAAAVPGWRAPWLT